MITLDLFENTNPVDQSTQIPVAPHVAGEKNRQIGNANQAALLSALNNPENPSVSIQFLDGSREVLSPAQIDLIIYYYNKILTTKTQKANFLYRTLVSRNKLFSLLAQLEEKKATAQAGQKSFSFAPDPVNPDEVKPQQLDLFKEEKKSSKYKDVAVQRAMRQAQADFPSADSDTEAFAKSMLVQQDQDQKNIDRLKSAASRAQELIAKNDDLDQTQARSIDSIQREIDKVEKDNDSLSQMVQQMNRANAELQQKLSRMRGKAPAEPATVSTSTPQLGVSVATDKAEPAQPEAPSSPIDIGARQKIDQVSKAVVGQILSLQNKEADQGLNPAEQERLDKLEAQVAKLSKQLKRSGIDIPDQLARVAQNDPYARVAANAMHEDQTHGLTETESIPLKSVVQGYNIDYNPRTRQVTVSRRGQVIGRGTNRLNSPKYHLTLINRIIDQAEEDKYPTDIDDRDVALPMRTATEGSVFGQQKFDTQMDLAKLKSQLTQPKPAQSAPAGPTQPQPVAYQPPARLSDLQVRKQRVDNLASIKQTIEQLQARATRGGRELPPGLAADLEDYFTTADIDTDYDEMMSKYQRQLAALQKYLNLRRAVWAPKKETNEMKARELQEGGSQTWTVYFTDGTKATISNVNDETDPAKVRAFLAKKGMTVKKFDYGFGTSSDTVSKPEPHEPGSGSARSARTGEELPEGEVVNINRGGFNAFRDKNDWLDKRDYVQQQLLDPRQRDNYPELKQRLLDINSVGRKLGYTK
jgi:hypothetical protein